MDAPAWLRIFKTYLTDFGFATKRLLTFYYTGGLIHEFLHQ